MACNFSIPISNDPEQVLNKARSAVQGQGGNFEGDTESGKFDVSVFGNKIVGFYRVTDSALSITITDKPFMISCGMIESYLKGQIT